MRSVYIVSGSQTALCDPSSSKTVTLAITSVSELAESGSDANRGMLLLSLHTVNRAVTFVIL